MQTYSWEILPYTLTAAKRQQFYTYYINFIQGVCSLRSHTLWLVAACRLLQSGNRPSVDKCIFKFSAVAHAHTCQAFGWKRVVGIMHPASPSISQEQKLIGVLTAMVKAASLQQKSVSQFLSTAKANRNYIIFPPRSDWVANYRPTRVSVSVDLTLALPNYPSSTLAAWGQAFSVTRT